MHELKAALNQIERLLYGMNYAVFLRLYGPAAPELGLSSVLKTLVSAASEPSLVAPASALQAMTIIKDCLLYKGDEGSGPLALELKTAEILSLIDKVFSSIDIEHADMVVEFAFKQGHPDYPVFWDFAFDLHVKDKRWILVGSSSD
ncbi:MAG: hypothetical protein J0M22_11840 [Gammaproteobacteria bacterium]|nr:hypothetical protein [Gammaproteobacteria bacterium]